MNAVTLHCPACRTPLRVRDPEMLRRSIDCPECGESIPPVEEPAASGPVEETSSRPSAASDESVDRLSQLDATPKAAEDDVAEPKPTRNRTLDRLVSPVVVAWSSAAVVTGILLVLFFSGDDEAPANPTGPSGETVVENPMKDEPAPAEADEPPAVHGHMQRLAARLLAERARTGRLPAGADEEHAGVGKPLSWIARLEAADALGGLDEPDWSLSYDDLRNADFVRRERPAFLNPAVETTRSQDGEPVTHFVGVGGVGEDGPALAWDHPRAGMFGIGRASGLDGVGDGLTNTMMIAGVRTSLGSWAAAGAGTVRPFVREPYVNGPDGFGTGQADGMFVLMGDGSVRTIAVGADPRIVRRMAAANDGLDLELEQPGEPGDSFTEPPPPIEVARNDRPEVDPPMPDPMPEVGDPEPPTEDPDPLLPVLPELPKWTPELVAEKLAQPLASFRTSRPVVAENLLHEVAEMCGVPIHADPKEGVDLAVFEQQVSLSVEKGTVATVLEALLAKLELAYVVADDGIHLRPVPPTPEVP